jgi:hypothetical protein
VLIVIVAVLARNGPGDRLGRVIVDYVIQIGALLVYTNYLYLIAIRATARSNSS